MLLIVGPAALLNDDVVHLLVYRVLYTLLLLLIRLFVYFDELFFVVSLWDAIVIPWLIRGPCHSLFLFE